MDKLTTLACVILVSSANAQGSFVVPRRNAGRSGNAFDNFTFYFSTLAPQPVRSQLVYSTSDIQASSALIRAIHFRPANIITGNPAATAALTVDMSVGPNDALAASTVFANNHGGSPTRVFGGNLSLPAAPYMGPSPSPFLAKIPFTTFFPYAQTAGRGLVVDLRVTSYVPAVNFSWFLDAQGTVNGGRADNGPPTHVACRFSNGSYNHTIAYPGAPRLGATWYVIYSGLLPNAPGIGAIGNVGAGQRWAGTLLPIDLGPLGAPRCAWHTNTLWLVPLLANGTGDAGWPNVQIPNDPALADGSFFDQALFLDAAANAAGIATTSSSKWTIGSGVPTEGAQVYRLKDTLMDPTGFLAPVAVVAEFVH